MVYISFDGIGAAHEICGLRSVSGECCSVLPHSHARGQRLQAAVMTVTSQMPCEI